MRMRSSTRHRSGDLERIATATRPVGPLSVEAVVALRSLRRRIVAGIVLAAVAMLAIGLFNAAHGGQWQFLLPGIVLNLVCVVQLVAGIPTLGWIARIETRTPGHGLGAELSRLIALRARVARATLVAGNRSRCCLLRRSWCGSHPVSTVRLARRASAFAALAPSPPASARIASRHAQRTPCCWTGRARFLVRPAPWRWRNSKAETRRDGLPSEGGSRDRRRERECSRRCGVPISVRGSRRRIGVAFGHRRCGGRRVLGPGTTGTGQETILERGAILAGGNHPFHRFGSPADP